MNDTKEICLYFEKGTHYQPIDVAKEIVNRYPELGNPVLLPENPNHNVPLIMFQENPTILLRCNYHTLNFVIDHTFFNKIESMIFDMVDLFEEFNTKFVRIGYVNNVFLTSDAVDRARRLYLKEDKSEDMEEFQVFLFKELETKYGKINAWERVISEGNDKHDLLMQYDFNSKQKEIIEFDMKYIKEFIKCANEYIESRTDI